MADPADKKDMEDLISGLSQVKLDAAAGGEEGSASAAASTTIHNADETVVRPPSAEAIGVTAQPEG